jgi:hypothetical protein
MRIQRLKQIEVDDRKDGALRRSGEVIESLLLKTERDSKWIRNGRATGTIF